MHGRYNPSIFSAMIYIGKYKGGSYITEIYQSIMLSTDA